MKGHRLKKLITRYSLLVTILLLFAIHCSLFTVVFASDKWPGVDESVVEKFAKEHGREAKEPLINTDQGDLLLFVFLLAGTVGGFAAGYYWRILTEGRSQKSEVRIQTENR
jgi:ABC-type cobalt transport system substrate-binding protein